MDYGFKFKVDLPSPQTYTVTDEELLARRDPPLPPPPPRRDIVIYFVGTNEEAPERVQRLRRHIEAHIPSSSVLIIEELGREGNRDAEMNVKEGRTVYHDYEGDDKGLAFIDTEQFLDYVINKMRR